MKTTLFFSILLLSFLLCIPFYSLNAHPTLESLCGPNSLLVIFQKLGVKTSLEEVAQLSDYNDKEGTTLLDLYQAARKKGLYAEGEKISLDEIAGLKTPVIAYLWDNHFLVVEGTNTDTLIITDPPKEPQPTPKDKFQPFYSGFALIISKNKISLPKKDIQEPDIRFDSYIYNFGKTELGQKIEHVFTFKNKGDQELIISKVRTTCNCTVALLSNKNIPPGGTGEIRVSFNTAGRNGSQVQGIFVHSNDPVTPITQLLIQGMVKVDIVISPKSLILGDIRKGTVPTREIHIIDKTDENVKITKVESYPSFLSAILFPITNQPYQRSKILVFVTPNAPLGSMEGKVIIYTTDKNYKIEIPVTANIIGDIELYPSMFFFGSIKQGEMYTSQITLTTIGDIPFRIDKIKIVGLPFLSVKAVPMPGQEGKKYTLLATLSKDTPTGNIKGTVAVYTNNLGQSQIKIPVYGFVEKANE